MVRARPSVVALSVAALSSCAGPGPRASSTPATSSASSVSVPVESSSASAPPPSSAPAVSSAPPRRMAPPKPDGIDSESFAILADICATSVWAGPQGPMVGCRSNPPFDKPEKQPDGTLRQTSDFSEVCFLGAIHRGSFSGPGKEQAILQLEACGPERLNDITPGNVVLAEHGTGGWRVVAQQLDTNVRTCAVSKRQDHSLLVCSDNFGAYGDGSISWRFTLDFAAPEKQRVKVFSKIYASAPTSCMMGTGMLEERGITTVSIKDERFADTDGDGDEDLSFTVERAHAPPSTALGARADAQCKGTKPGVMVDFAKLAGPKKRHVLQFRGEATSLVPTDATQKLLDAWGVEAPEFWWNVVKSAAP